MKFNRKKIFKSIGLCFCGNDELNPSKIIFRSHIISGMLCLFLLTAVCYADTKETRSIKDLSLEITIEDAILIALENNRAFQIERLRPEIVKTFEDEQESRFDTNVSARATKSRSSLVSGIADITGIERSQYESSVNRQFSTGTRITAGVKAEDLDSELRGSSEHSTQVYLTVNQALLRGFGRAANLAGIERARAATEVSEYQLRGFAESLVAEVEKTCWDYVLQQRRMKIFEDSLKLAEDQLAETQKRVDVGGLARVEIYAAQAEVALRREALINARSNLQLTELRLRRLLNFTDSNFIEQKIAVVDEPVAGEVVLDEAVNHVKAALEMRPEMNQARLEIERGELETISTRNGLLPVLDFFITLGKTGYADSFGTAFSRIDDNKYDFTAGLSFEFPIRNRAQRARHERAVLGSRQVEEALGNLEQLVVIDVRSALIEVTRAREQVSATAATRVFQEESLRAETEKFRVGKSTALLVARAQRDYLVGQLEEINALITYIKAIISLYQSEGTLLERRGIFTSGN